MVAGLCFNRFYLCWQYSKIGLKTFGKIGWRREADLITDITDIGIPHFYNLFGPFYSYIPKELVGRLIGQRLNFSIKLTSTQI